MFHYSLYEFIWIFIIYGFFGWCLEVIVATIRTRKFINRGFLIGPFCPIYGFGVIAVITLLASIENNLPLLFIGSLVLATLLEFVTGYILEMNFNQKWWDYSSAPFNIKGYVCLKMSITWGVACVFVIYFLQPTIDNLIHWLPGSLGVAFMALLLLILVADTIMTIIVLLKLKKKIHILDETSDRIRLLSESIGKNISGNTITAIDLKDRYLQELDNLNKKYQTILNKRVFGYERITKAFPRLHLIKSKKNTNTKK